MTTGICPNCGRNHFRMSVIAVGRAKSAARVFCAQVSSLEHLMTANGNCAPVDASAPRRKLTIAESIARNKVRYAKTLERLA